MILNNNCKALYSRGDINDASIEEEPAKERGLKRRAEKRAKELARARRGEGASGVVSESLRTKGANPSFNAGSQSPWE